MFRSQGRPGSSDSGLSATTTSKFLGGKRGVGAVGARSVCSSVPAPNAGAAPGSGYPGSALHNVVPVDVQVSHRQPRPPSSTFPIAWFSSSSVRPLQEEFQRLYSQLEALRERNLRLGNRHLADRIHAMQEASRRGPLPALPVAKAAAADACTSGGPAGDAAASVSLPTTPAAASPPHSTPGEAGQDGQSVRSG